MKDYKTYLFDLDGTLTDSGPGIMNSFEYATAKMGKPVTDRAQLRRFVGPPLADSFGKALGYSEEDTQKAITLYREYYFNHGGALENEVYPGITELLDNLKKSGKKLAIATSKTAPGTKLVLEHFGLNKYFDVVATANDTDVLTKTDVIRLALTECGITDKSSVVMVGDRHYDIASAGELGIDSVGVLWGYGDRKELESAGATYVVDKPEEILTPVAQPVTKNNICSDNVAEHQIVLATEEDRAEILALYDMQKGREFCPWDEDYPSDQTIDFDLSRDALYVLKIDGRIHAAISLEEDPDVDVLECWNPNLNPSSELARLAVLPDEQSRGLGRIMLGFGMEELKRRGNKGIHFLVNKHNIKAIRCYATFGFNVVGECFMYDQDFLCYEKEL